MYCHHCGTKYDLGTLQCFECGISLNSIHHIPQIKSTKLGMGYLFAILSLFFFPIIFGPIGIFIGAKAKSQGYDYEGTRLIIVAFVLMFFGIMIGAFIGGLGALLNDIASYYI